MEWDKEMIARLETSVRERFLALRKEIKTDRKNMSEIWNKRLRELDIQMLRPKKELRGSSAAVWLSGELIRLVNFDNDRIVGRILVCNPDRIGQYLLVPRDVANKILMLGMP